MKITRITLNTGDAQFFVDRPYSLTENDFVNCNSAMNWLQTTYEANKCVAVMKMGAGSNFVVKGKDGKDEQQHDPFFGATPALLNFDRLSWIAIDNVGVYEDGSSTDVETSNEDTPVETDAHIVHDAFPDVDPLVTPNKAD